MNKAVPWRIKGVPFDARTAAMEAARRSGMSLGEWLNTVIEEQAQADGVDERDLDADDRLEAVTRRLSSMRDDGPPRHRADRGRQSREPDPVSGEPDEQPRVAPPSRHRQPAPREDARNEFKAEHLLENAIAAFDRRAHRSSERTARALSEVAELLDAGHRERARDDGALSAIADRLTGIEERVARGSVPTTDPAIHDAIARLERRVTREAAPQTDPAIRDTLVRLEQRIETLSKQTKRAVAQDAPRERAAATELLATTAITAPAPKRPLAAAIAEVARRQQELDADSPREVRHASPARAHGFVAPAVRNASPAAVASATPLNPLETRLAALVERLEKSATLKEPAPRAEFTGLEGHINMLADRIETMRNEIAARPAPVASARGDDGIADIRRELAAMTKAISELAPRASVSALETAVRDLSGRVADSRIDGAGEAALAPVEALVRELLGVVRSVDPSAAIDSLDRGIRAVATKLEAFSGITVSDPQAAREVAEQTRAMRDSLAQLAEKQIPAERIERGLVDLSARVDAIASAGVDPLGRGEMAQRVGEIRAMLSDPVAQERTLQTLEKKLEGIAARIDTMFGERFDTMQRSFAAQIDARSDGPDVENLVNDLGTRLDNALSSGLKAMERTVARLVEANNAPRPEAPATRLEEMVRDLAARVDAGASAGIGADALEGVQQQIARLAEHFDKTDRTAETLVALQESVSDLFTRIEQSQNIAVEAAEAAARAAAAEHARDGSDIDPELAREVADLRLLQNTADHRTHATLAAVHETLSRVVERLSNLEDDVAETRQELPLPAREPIPFRTPRASVPERRDTEDAPAHDIDDIFIEPGSSFDRRPAGSRAADDRAELRPQASFIQAARRAAQAAQTVGDATPLDKTAGKRSVELEEKTGNAPLDTVRAYYASRKRPILLSLAALMIIFGAWQVAKVAIEDRPATATSSLAPAPAAREKTAEKLPSAAKLDMPVPPAATNIAPAPAAPAPRAAAVPPPIEIAPVETAAAPPAPAIDRSPVGTIGLTPAPAVDTNGIVRALAVTGDPAAQFELAVRYGDGKLLSRDLKLSKEWFEKAAAKGVVPAQYRLGALYERGIGVPKDSAQAKIWYQRAADAGNARAMHNLAVLAADTADGKPNYAEAISWFRRAAEFGVKDSQFNLAILYARGMGTPANMTEAYQWFAAAAAQGDEDAAKKRDDVGARLPPNDLARAKALSAAFKPKTLDAAANEVAPPPGGWESVKMPARPDQKTNARPKVSAL